MLPYNRDLIHRNLLHLRCQLGKEFHHRVEDCFNFSLSFFYELQYQSLCISLSHFVGEICQSVYHHILSIFDDFHVLLQCVYCNLQLDVIERLGGAGVRIHLSGYEMIENALKKGLRR